jgi:hypothetical protein
MRTRLSIAQGRPSGNLHLEFWPAILISEVFLRYLFKIRQILIGVEGSAITHITRSKPLTFTHLASKFTGGTKWYPFSRNSKSASTASVTP